MNHALPPLSGAFAIPTRPEAAPKRVLPLPRRIEDATFEENERVRRLRTLLALFALYAGSLLTVILVSDGADIGCILAGIAGHVLYATHRMVASWRDATWLEHARLRMRARRA